MTSLPCARGWGGDGRDNDTLVLIQAGRGLLGCLGTAIRMSMYVGDWREGAAVTPYLVCLFAGRLVSWTVFGGFVGRLVGWPVVWFTGWLVGWSANLLVGCNEKQYKRLQFQNPITLLDVSTKQ